MSSVSSSTTNSFGVNSAVISATSTTANLDANIATNSATVANTTTPSILQKIIASRLRSKAQHGHTMGAVVPSKRPADLPVVPFNRAPCVICEIKKQSPSRGVIDEQVDPIRQATRYVNGGVRSVSVLTEADYFKGSLQDLIDVKRAHPQLAVLRKDFLIDEQDIEVSYRAGADAVLLIASILSPQQLATLHNRTEQLGMTPLVEIHNKDDLQTVVSAAIVPQMIGINARDLSSFLVDLLAPLQLRPHIPWPCDVIFESGIFSALQIALIKRAGFSGVLIGEAAMTNKRLPQQVVDAFVSNADASGSGGKRVIRDGNETKPLNAQSSAKSENDMAKHGGGGTADDITQSPHSKLKFDSSHQHAAGTDFWWHYLAVLDRRQGDGVVCKRPVVKICGLCNATDVELATELGADLIGFVFAESKRRASIKLLQQVSAIDVIKVAVINTPPTDELIDAYYRGLIDVFQYHGGETPQQCIERGLPFYKALGVKNSDEVGAIMHYPIPRVLIDAYNKSGGGGTGKTIADDIVRAAAQQKPLWLAGGIGVDNVRSIIDAYHPELIDLSSGVELEPGKKDVNKLTAFFTEVNRGYL